MWFSTSASLCIFLCVSVKGLNNGLSERPPMGWSALYGAPFGGVNETILKRAAEGLNKSGLLELGYRYVTIDDWWATRDENGDIKAVPSKFPSGMRAVADHVHDQGCKFGVYSAASERTCGNYSASLFNEVRDANTLANEFQIDFLKYDACLYNGGVASRARYLAMSRALNATGRQIFYSVEGWNPEAGDWGPEVANMWRTGSDIWPNWDHDLCILNNLYQTNLAAPYNRWSMETAGTLSDHAGGGFNDGDMLQPPNTLLTVLKPGLTTEEAMSQFKLWAIMKAPLILGTNWQQLADVANLAPEYYSVISNTELIAVNQDPSPQATLVAQYPSKAQQSNATGLNVTLQQCDLSRPDQRFSPSSATGSIALLNTSLCLSVEDPVEHGSATIVAKPCSIVKNSFELAKDSQLTVVAVTGSGPATCLTDSSASLGPISVLGAKACIAPQINHHSKVDPVPIFPFASSDTMGPQTFIWDTQSDQIVAAGSGKCLTVGNPNYDPNLRGVPYTNHFTLEHEVWMGPLTDTSTGTKRRVVALFNKGSSEEMLTASSSIIGTDKSPMKLRDVVSKQDLQSLPTDTALVATVPSHSVRVFILESVSD